MFTLLILTLAIAPLVIVLIGIYRTVRGRPLTDTTSRGAEWREFDPAWVGRFLGGVVVYLAALRVTLGLLTPDALPPVWEALGPVRGFSLLVLVGLALGAHFWPLRHVVIGATASGAVHAVVLRLAAWILTE